MKKKLDIFSTLYWVRSTAILHGTLIAAGSNLLLLELLLRDLLLLGLLTTTGKCLLLLHEADLDVAGAAHVRIDPTVGPVCSTPHLGSTVNLKLIVTKCSNLKFVMTNLDVLDDKVVGIQSLVLSIALSVLQQMKEEFS